MAELIAGRQETVDLSQPYAYVDPEKPWKTLSFEKCTYKEMLRLVVKDGVRLLPHIPLEEIRSYVKVQLEYEIWDEEQRFYNPHKHYLDMSPSYYQEKMDLLHKIGR